MLSCFRIALWHIKSWKGSARVIVVLFLAVAMTVYQSTEYIEFAKICDGVINCLETYIVVTNNNVHSVVMFIITMILFADAPFMDNNSLYVVSRVGRFKWCIGKIIYIIIATLVFNALIMLTTVLISLPYSYMGNIWSIVFVGVLDGDAIANGCQATFGNRDIVYMFAPMQTALISGGIKVLLGCVIGMLLFVLNIANGKVLGYGVVSIIYFAEYTVSGMKIARFFLVENSTLAMQTGISNLRWSCTYFGGITLICIILSFLLIRKVDYKITTGDRV